VGPDGRPVSISLAEFARQDRAEREQAFRNANVTNCARETGVVEHPGEFNDKKQLITPARIVITVVVTRQCMSVQVNESIKAMRRGDRVMGTGTPCIGALSFPGSELDVTVRELVRILYFNGSGKRDGGMLAPSTIDHMYDDL